MGEVLFGDLNRTLGEMIARSQNLEPALREGALLFTSEFQKNFAEGGRPEKWPPSKRALKEGGQTLRDSGALEHSVLQPQVDSQSVTFGSNLPYAAIHQFGGEIRRAARSEIFKRSRISRGPRRGQFKGGTETGRGMSFKEYVIKMPARPFLYVSQGAEETFGQIVRDHVLNRS